MRVRSVLVNPNHARVVDAGSGGMHLSQINEE